MTRLRWTPLLILAAACTPPGSTGNWWDVQSGDSAPALDGDEGDGDENDEDDEDGEDDGAWWWGEGQDSGADFSGEGGFLALRFEGKNEIEDCVIEWTWSTQSTATDCEACEVAWTLVRSDVDVSIDGPACAQLGDASSLEGSTVRVGGRGETMYVDEGAGWVEAGWFERDGGTILFERFLGEQEDEGEEDDEDGEEDDR